tara:strand:- start:1045 stop:1239 length:195 start_codon:yes stop_codon:yes gene_type:complete
MSFLTKGNDNIWQDEREDVIQKRGIDCSPYIEEARLYIEKEKLEQGETSSRTICTRIGETIICR